MQKLLIWVSVLLVVIVGGRQVVTYMSRTAHENAATTRVEAFLDGMTAEGDFQNAFVMWIEGNANAMSRMTQDEYNMNVAELTRWMAQARLAHPIQTYEIGGATLVREAEGIEPAEVEVSCTVNGKPFVILAADGRRLEWSD